MLKISPSLIIILLLETHCEGQEIEAFQPDIAVSVHNNYRKSEGSSNMKALRWDEDLAIASADYAKTCNFEHAPNVPHGENLQISSGNFDSFTLGKAIAAWYGEKNNYNFSTNTCAPKKICGHYTQVVWANSELVGCAVATCSSITNGFKNDTGGTFAICRYSPAGNFVGQSPMKKGASCSECGSGWDCKDGLCVPATSTQKPETVPGLAVTTVAVASTVEDTKTMEPTKPTQPLPKQTTTESSRPNSTTKGVTTPAKMSTTKGPMATKPQFTSPKPTATAKPPYTTESPTSTASPPQLSCSKEYSRMLRDYNILFEDYKKEFNKWKDMTSENSCSQND